MTSSVQTRTSDRFLATTLVIANVYNTLLPITAWLPIIMHQLTLHGGQRLMYYVYTDTHHTFRFISPT